MFTSAKTDVLRSGRFLCHSVSQSVCLFFVQPHGKIYMKFLLKVNLGRISRWFKDVIQSDLHCHLEVTVAQQGHFGIKSTVMQKR